MFSGDLKCRRDCSEDDGGRYDDYASAPYIRTMTGIRAEEAVLSILSVGATRTELETALRHCRSARLIRGRRGLMTGRVLRLYRLIALYQGESAKG